jgi:V/A-type H+-transporting ATPase subunit E
MGMEKISEAILDKVRAEAKDIIKDAEEKAKERIAKARKQQEARLEEEKTRLMEQTRSEAARIMAQASIKARQQLLAVKTGMIDEVIAKVKKTLSDSSGGKGSYLNLVREAVGTLGVDKVRIYVAPKDVAATQKLVKENKELAGKVKEVKEFNCTGGVIIEDVNGKIRIDNTYDTRLETLLPQILPEISKELFGTE